MHQHDYTWSDISQCIALVNGRFILPVSNFENWTQMQCEFYIMFVALCKSIWNFPDLQLRKMLSLVASAFGHFRVWRTVRKSVFYRSLQWIFRILSSSSQEYSTKCPYSERLWAMMIFSTFSGNSRHYFYYHVSLWVAFKILCGKWVS
jgi:hypothetical protein